MRFVVFAIFLLLHSPRAVAGDERVRHNQPLSEILGSRGVLDGKAEIGGLAAPEELGRGAASSVKEESARGVLERSRGVASTGLGENSLVRLSLWVVGLGLFILVALVFYRRRVKGVPRLEGGEGIQIVGRTAISPRHAVVVLRISNHRLIVGLAGERMTSLGILDDSSVETVPREPGFSARPEDQEAVARARTIKDSDLVPYRQQVDRLRGLLKGVREDFAGEETQEESKQ
jgi:flagellar biogenesis protein FliO